MTGAEGTNRVVAALRYLHAQGVFYWFDEKERVEAVSLCDNTGADEIAAHVSCLHDLRRLQFVKTDLTDAGLHQLKPLVKLRRLELKNPLLTGEGLACLAGMMRLRELSIGGEKLDGRGFQYLAKLRNLVELTIKVGRFGDDDLASLGSLLKLEELSLTHNDAIRGTFASHLSRLPRLRKLTLGEHLTDEGLACIARLPYLETLHVEGPFTDVGLTWLRAMKSLQNLSIHSPHVTQIGLSVVAELPALTSLSLDTPRLADDVIPSLERCSALEELSFRTPVLTDAGLQYLRDTMPRCEVSDLVRDHYEGQPEDEEQKNRSRYKSDTPFETLLVKAKDWDLVNGTFSKISDRYDNWIDASAFSSIERVIMLVWHVTALIDNGGFEYLFAGEIPGDPDFHVTADACKTAGLVRCYEAFQEAFSLFPGGIVPHNPEDRSRMYDEANRSKRDAINRNCWRDGRDHLLERKLAWFIRQHAAELRYLDDAP